MTNVYTNRSHAGTLNRGNQLSRFTYTETATGAHTVSLTMPAGPSGEFTMNEPNVVHPVFAMNLPEGRLRDSLVGMFAKTLPDADYMTHLETVGRSQIGRLRIAPLHRGTGLGSRAFAQQPAQHTRHRKDARRVAEALRPLFRRGMYSAQSAHP
jgi:serine/threonine-protein kinase HipA